MNQNKPLSLVLIEDDVSECVKFKDSVNRRGDAVFVGMTSSSDEGLKLVKNYLPEGVVLDLELHKGSGSGLQFLDSLRNTKLGLRPIVVVTTNTASNVVYNVVHASGADMIFYKGQADYSPDLVLNTFQALRKSLQAAQQSGVPSDIQSIETPEEIKTRLTDRIDTELDLIGISPRLKGRGYFEGGIYLLLTGEQNADSDSIIKQLAIRHKHSYTTIARAMQTAINDAWQSAPIEDLQLHYTARINYHTGVPSPTEFIYYYANKIRKTM